MLIPILGALIPILVTQAEKLFPGPSQGSQKHAWVQGVIANLVTDVEKKLPPKSGMIPAIDEIQQLVENLIEQTLDRIDP